MNASVLAFFVQHYAPGRVCLIGSRDPAYMAVRIGQSGITLDRKPSKWNHVFLMGERSPDGKVVHILESDIHVSVKKWQIINGPQESTIDKWCLDSLDHACVLGMDLTADEQRRVVAKGTEMAYDPKLKYPVLELVGTLFAQWFKRMRKRNIFDDPNAIQCATFTQRCYKAIGKDPLAQFPDHESNASPERFAQSGMWTFRKEWVPS